MLDQIRQSTAIYVELLPQQDVVNAKSSCVDEIKQLFPVSLKKFEVMSVDHPSWVQLGAHEKKRVSQWCMIC